MMNLVSFETPPLGRKDRANTTITATAATRASGASSSSTCFHSHLDLSLGISLSNGGGGCNATGCSGIKTSCGGPQGSGGDKNIAVGCMTSGTITTTTTANVLTAGHCHVSDMTAGDGWTTAFMPSPTGFMHPWSLAARQQKAAAEQQDRTPPAMYLPSNARIVPLPSAVGWPPVHTSRRNIVTSMHVTKTGGATVTADGPNSSTTTHAGGLKDVAPTDSTVLPTRPPANMFAKVHMEGYTIGRKINLRAHCSYDSLSRVLTKMTRNFFCPADCSNANTGEEDLPNSDKFIFFYEDFEGDRMLVGDVPWELFLASAKRLFIVRNPTSRDKGHGEGEGKNKTEEPTKN